jgi:hypothetical protein
VDALKGELHEFFGSAGRLAVAVGGVEEIDAGVVCSFDRLDSGTLGNVTPLSAHPPRAETDGADIPVGLSQNALNHVVENTGRPQQVL